MDPHVRAEAVLAVRTAEQVRDLLRLYPELKLLTEEVDGSPGTFSSAGEATFSQVIFEGVKHPEFDRTIAGILAISWLLKDDYESFVEGQVERKLSRKSFAELRDLFTRVMDSDEALDAMVTFMVVNDLGKVNSIAAMIEERAGITDVDHDNLLYAALEKFPDIAPSFLRLDKSFQKCICLGLGSRWNGGQGLQGEDLDASWSGIAQLDRYSLEFYMVHLIADIAGAAGHFSQKGSLTMNEDTWTAFRLLLNALEGFSRGKSPSEVRGAYLRSRGELLGVDVGSPRTRAIAVIGCMLRRFDRHSGARIERVFDGLPDQVRAILECEMNGSGLESLGTLLYYAPDTLNNLIKQYSRNAEDPERAFEEALTAGLTLLARLYHKTSTLCRKREGGGVVKVFIRSIAQLAASDCASLCMSDFIFREKGGDYEVSLTPRSRINAACFPRIERLSELPGSTVAVIGIGGGSDVLQAALLAGLLEKAGKKIVLVGSVRTAETGSQGNSGKVGEIRRVENHGGLVAPGIYSITPETSGSGRFLEYLPANRYPVYLILDQLDATVHVQLQTLLGQEGRVDTLFLVDTGGDALFSIHQGEEDEVRATPDQDLRILQAAHRLSGVRILTCEVACGVDSPGALDFKEAQTVLQEAQARYFPVGEQDAIEICSSYVEWRERHSLKYSTRFLGKTPLAFEAALQGKQGYHCLDIDPRLVVDRNNPWDPFVFIDGGRSGRDQAAFEPAMNGIFFMELEDHLRSIGCR